MRRAAAARANECGLQILNLPRLAARLAGGFTVPLAPEHLDVAVLRALDGAGFVELEPVRSLPGMVRAVARTLRKLWDADLDLLTLGDSQRIGELRLIEERVQEYLPEAVLSPRDLRNAAQQRIQHAPRLLGPVCIEQLSFIQPVWRPLIEALAHVVPVEWRAPRHAETDWFSGKLIPANTPLRETRPTVVSCADPRHEVVEALRWARYLITAGIARPDEIAIASASTSPWDDHFLALVSETGLSVHFAHGIPALATLDGQRCAALADVLLHGLSQRRVRRLVSLCHSQSLALSKLPDHWLAALPRGATLPATDDWRRAVEEAVLKDGSLASARSILPLLDILARGPAAAGEAADMLLGKRSLDIWQAATRAAPADALELSLRDIRLAAETDAADSIVWCSARDLAAAPRQHVRLLGLTNRSWPRRVGDDPVLPRHVLSAFELDADPPSRADRRHFTVVLDAASGGAVLSRSRRGGEGSRVGRSPLLEDHPETVLSRARIPEHAYSEADRLMARPQDAAEIKRVSSAALCWHDWHVEGLTPHDGQFGADDPAIVRAIERVQSATSLQRLLRDPLGFVWRYALGWTSPEEREESLSIAALDFGRLVHELLRRAVDSLEPDPGYARASDFQIEHALNAAAAVVREGWPLQRPVPPRLLWSNTVDYGARLALVALLRKEIAEEGTRSWTEVPFGQSDGFDAGRELPWNPTTPVFVPGTLIRLRGAVDRLDLRTNPFAVRVTDYKTGAAPRNALRIIIGGGAELQRALYGLACRQLLDGEPQVVSRLLYLSGHPLTLKLGNLDATIKQISTFVSEAVLILRRGRALAGPLSYDRANDLRLALPASPAYERRKRLAFAKAGESLSGFWSAP
ncbi:PD-(D/E)XK nuclease family protein [Bradyrhizobium pachyrhizi]|uniref:PD-(D/E)XK nuclease family protein n=2 Tax=Bradyrhizobium pachyrhizi TaxID=280333 RepID=A0A844SQX8_9BRAD|nr:PD-(D/E)XK nuclease family protein [Bradyrhizobium pachyrhizi]